jgi:hypothetical protein
MMAAFLLGTTATLFAQTNVSFELKNDGYFTTSGPVVQGDFNNDGKPDVIEGVYLRLGNGDGTFQPPQQVLTIPNGPQDMVAADLNGDGNMDVAAVTITANPSLYIWFGNGDGTFQSPLTLATTNSPRSLTVGNFFGDGHPDIAVGEVNGNIDFFKNEGGSNYVFAKAVNIAGSSYDVIRVRAGNMNGNGVATLAAMTYDGVWALWDDGQGNFTPVELSSYVAPDDLGVADLNQDGLADIIVSYTCNPTPTNNPGKGPQYNPCAGVDVYYGQGNSKTFKRTVVTDPGVYPIAGPMGIDVNGDGLGDVVGTSSFSTSAGLFVWLGNANGSFQQTPQQFVVNTNGTSAAVAGDFNRDGMIDFFTAEGSSEIYLNATNRAPCATSTINPTVTVCQPVDNSYSTSPVTVQANAYDKTPVTAMQEYVDGALEYSHAVTSFTATFPVGPGTHSFVTKAWDQNGVSFRSNRTITEYTGTPGSVCPAAPESASICLPQGTSTSSPVHIVANGYTNVVPTAAQLYIDGSLVLNDRGCQQGGTCSGGSSALDTMQNLSGGNHQLVFKLWDASGDVYTATKTITVE